MEDNGIVDFNSLDKIVNLVCKPTPTLTVKHVIRLTRQSPTGNKNEKIAYAWNYKLEQRGSIPAMSGLYFNSTSFIQLTGTREAPTDENQKSAVKKINCDIEPRNFITFLSMLDVGYRWLAGDLHNKTFMLDSAGRPLKLYSVDTRETCPLSQTDYVSIRPSIIRDASDVRYEGIMMTVPGGELTSFTAVEFASFRDQMHNLLPNIYTATSVLINQAITYSIYTKSKRR